MNTESVELVTIWDGSQRFGKDSDLLVPVQWSDPKSACLPRETSPLDMETRARRRQKHIDYMRSVRRDRRAQRFTAVEYQAMRARLTSREGGA